jgi:glyoxylase I family protein
VTKVHHTAVCTTDVEASLRFWRDGLGFVVQMDLGFDGGWRELFGAPSDHLRSVFLGQPGLDDAGILELVDLGEVPTRDGDPVPAQGFFLVSVYVGDVDDVLARLARLGVGGEPRRIEVHGVAMAVVRDPDGVRVELIGLPG